MGRKGCKLLILLLFELLHTLSTKGIRFPSRLVRRGTVGVDYGRLADNLMPPEKVVLLLKSQGISRVRIYDADRSVIQAFANSGIELTVGVPNIDVPSIADRTCNCATNWFNEHISPFKSSGIAVITVGNEWLSNKSNDPSLLLPAMENLQAALNAAGLQEKIKITTPFSMDVIDPTSSFPPSAGQFRDDLLPLMQSILSFLDRTSSFFMVNIFPYFSYIANPRSISLDYALFRNSVPVRDVRTGLDYFNLYDAQLDAVYSAIVAAGINLVHVERNGANLAGPSFSSMRVKSSESGWPSGPGSSKQRSPPGGGRPPWESNLAADLSNNAASIENAQAFNQNLINHVHSGTGTPLRPLFAIDVNIFSLFNEDLKPVGEEQNFGLLYPNGTAVYPIHF